MTIWIGYHTHEEQSSKKCKNAVAHARGQRGARKPRTVIPSEARNLALRRADRTKKTGARFLASLGMTVHFRAGSRQSGRAAVFATLPPFVLSPQGFPINMTMVLAPVQKMKGRTREVWRAYSAYSGYISRRRRSSPSMRTPTRALASRATRMLVREGCAAMPAQMKYNTAE